jgi:hypothetical protein
LRFEPSPGKWFTRPDLEKPFSKIGLVEWPMVKAVSLSPSTSKTKQTNNNKKNIYAWRVYILKGPG